MTLVPVYVNCIQITATSWESVKKSQQYVLLLENVTGNNALHLYLWIRRQMACLVTCVSVYCGITKNIYGNLKAES